MMDPNDPCQIIYEIDNQVSTEVLTQDMKISSCFSTPGCECITAEGLQWSALLSRFDFVFIYVSSIILDIVFLGTYLPGIASDFYANLRLTVLNPWIPRVLWVAAIILSYIGLYFLWREIKCESDLERVMG